MNAGFAEADYAAYWEASLDADFGDTVSRLVRQGALVRDAGRVRLAREAQFVSDAVFAEFAPDRP